MKDYTQISLKERQILHGYLEIGLTVGVISKKLSRHRSMIYREISRNKESKYLPYIANQKAISRASNGRMSKLQRDGYLLSYVTKALKKGWIPEQISGRMKFQKLTMYVQKLFINIFINQRIKNYITVCVINSPKDENAMSEKNNNAVLVVMSD
jgi:IS30 family transposase